MSNSIERTKQEIIAGLNELARLTRDNKIDYTKNEYVLFDAFIPIRSFRGVPRELVDILYNSINYKNESGQLGTHSLIMEISYQVEFDADNSTIANLLEALTEENVSIITNDLTVPQLGSAIIDLPDQFRESVYHQKIDRLTDDDSPNTTTYSNLEPAF